MRGREIYLHPDSRIQRQTGNWKLAKALKTTHSHGFLPTVSVEV